MRFDLVTLFPEMFDAVLDYGVTSRALDKSLIDVAFWNPREYTSDAHRTVDDRPYGGGPGMVMRPEPLTSAIESAVGAQADIHGNAGPVIYLSPQGKPLDHYKVIALAALPAITLVSGRYEGIDERVIARSIDEELSIGDYVLAGGELAAMVVMEAVIRHIPGALGNSGSAAEDSFSDGLLDCPHFTRPETFRGDEVPAVLMSGDHGAIAAWRREQSLARTREKRPDLLAEISDSPVDPDVSN